MQRVDRKRLVVTNFRLVVMASGWPLLTGGRYSEVAARTGLTVYIYFVENNFSEGQKYQHLSSSQVSSRALMS
jgi:hypothetical protein